MVIKGIRIGTGKPIICVPVTREKKVEIVDEITKLVNKHVIMIEWRVDYFENVSDVQKVLEVLEELKPIIKKTIMLFTFRTKRQGGVREISECDLTVLLDMVAQSGCVDLIDVEYFEMENASKYIHKLQGMGMQVISSHHDFVKTPDENVMKRLLEQMLEGGADIVKLAVMPQSKTDVLALLKVTTEFQETYSGCPIVTMSMSGKGMISRISGEIFGSCITFGSYKKVSAPGQIQLDQLVKLLDIIHTSYGIEEL